MAAPAAPVLLEVEDLYTYFRLKNQVVRAVILRLVAAPGRIVRGPIRFDGQDLLTKIELRGKTVVLKDNVMLAGCP